MANPPAAEDSRLARSAFDQQLRRAQDESWPAVRKGIPSLGTQLPIKLAAVSVINSEMLVVG